MRWSCAMMGITGACFSAYADTPTFDYAPKLIVRMSSGKLQNRGTAGGSSSQSSGMDLSVLHYPIADFGFGLTYRTNFNFSRVTLPLSGWFLVSRWYFMGEGTRSRVDADRMLAERHNNYAFYGGLEMGQNSYYLGQDATKFTDKVNGSFLSIDGLAGVDWRLTDHFQINVEACLGFWSFASSDEHYRVQGSMLNFGISYVW